VPLDMNQFEAAVFEGFEDADLHDSFDIRWGPDNGLRIADGWATFESLRSQGWPDSGLIQGPFGPASGQGYGYYEATVQLEPNQGGGIAVLLWPGTNRWPGPEVDILETPDVERIQGFWVVHWAENGNNHYDYYINETDWTVPHKVGILWEQGRLSYFLDGELKQTTTEHVPVPFDEGGQNLVMGLQVTAADDYYQPSDAVRLHVDDVAYYAPKAQEPDAPVAAPNVPDGTPSSPTLSWDQIAAEVQRIFDLTGEWKDPFSDPAWFEEEAPNPPDPTVRPATDPTAGIGISWDLLAFREQAWFEANGYWGAPGWFLFGESGPDLPPDPNPPSSTPVDWNARAAEVTSNFDATGVWF
jgi:hypothetical protein